LKMCFHPKPGGGGPARKVHRYLRGEKRREKRKNYQAPDGCGHTRNCFNSERKRGKRVKGWETAAGFRSEKGSN